MTIIKTGKPRWLNHMHKLNMPSQPIKDRDLYLKIEGLAQTASIGIYPEERQQRQGIVLDIGWRIARSGLLLGDNIQNTVDYDAIIQAVERVLAERHFDLIETMVLSIETALLQTFPIRNLHLSVSKPAAIPSARGVSVSSYCV